MKKILLTGGSRGIGKAIFDELSESYVIDCPKRSDLDLESIDSIEHYLSYNHDYDIIINNAGINIIKETELITNSDIGRINLVNLVAPLKIIQACIPYMKKNSYGKIVNISSIWGVRSKEYRALYSGTKFGLIGQTRALAREYAADGIVLNCVCPGFTNTELTQASMSEKELNELRNEIPLRRLAQPQEIAKLVKFLISEDNTYITGQSIVIDGGFTA